MTIKPVVAAPQKRSGVSGSGDGDKKDTHSGSNVGDSASSSHQSASRASNVHAHRNVVIDSHGQSPQRRVDVYEELNRHRRSPHKSNRTKRRDHLSDHHHKRERVSAQSAHAIVPKCNSPHAGTSSSSVSGAPVSNSAVSHASVSGSKSPEHLLGSQSPKSQPSSVAQAASGLLKAIEDTFSGYNSGDEHLQPKEGAKTTADEWQRKDEQFAKCMADRGYILKPVEEDGACLFRSISLQIYGDEEMHDVIRQHTMDYIYKNREYFSHFVTEDINNYIKRKRRKESHGNHIEIQAMSEIYSRPVEVYCYKPTPINIFNSEQQNNGYAPLRLSYQRGSHYNAIIDPYNATVGVGLGLAGYKPELQTKEAVRLSEQLEIEQTMFEDKLKTTDWEATNEAIEEQIARESYLQWCRDNLHKNRNTTATSASTSATVTSGEAASDSEASPSKYAAQRLNALSGGSGGGGGAGCNSNTAPTLAGSSSSCSSVATTSTNTKLEHAFASLSPKHLSTKKSSEDIGFESDDTDMSSTSSAGNCSPSMTARSKNSKLRTSAGGAMRTVKKRRREAQNKSNEDDNSSSLHKSPKCDTSVEKRSLTPDFEQQKPCTSKQSHSPDKQSTAASSALPSSSTSCSASAMSGDTATTKQQTASNFYQELLEASYATEDFGQLNESEMLQRAIQMSTHDYIEDQKRKYLYGP